MHIVAEQCEAIDGCEQNAEVDPYESYWLNGRNSRCLNALGVATLVAPISFLSKFYL